MFESNSILGGVLMRLLLIIASTIKGMEKIN